MAGRLEDNRFISPRPGLLGRCFTTLLNCTALLRLRRQLFTRLPFLKLVSDVRDVVYLNWLVDTHKVEHLLPQGLRLWQHNGRTVLTVLTYRHGGFGPELAGPMRRFFGAPLQSNWRLYLEDGVQCESSVLFLSNIMDTALYVAGARLCSDALPTHLADRFQHECTGDGYTTKITGGQGSAPDIRYAVSRSSRYELPGTFTGLFSGWNEAVGFLALRESAVARLADRNQLAVAGIELPVDITTVVPLELQGAPESRALQDIVGDAVPFCFAVPQVKFRVLWEHLL